MTRDDFDSAFLPLATALTNKTERQINNLADVYFESLRKFRYPTFREVCLSVVDQDEFLPKPVVFRRRCFEHLERTGESTEIDSRYFDKTYGRRPQDLKAKAEFYTTLAKIGENGGAMDDRGDGHGLCNMKWALGKLAQDQVVRAQRLRKRFAVTEDSGNGINSLS